MQYEDNVESLHNSPSDSNPRTRSGYQRLYSDAEVDETMGTPLLSDPEPIATQSTPTTTNSCHDESSATFERIGEWLRCLRIGCDPDGIIGDCELALQDLVECSRRNASSQ